MSSTTNSATNTAITLVAAGFTPTSSMNGMGSNTIATVQEQQLSSKTARTWRKVGTQENPLGGRLVTYQYKIEYRNGEKMMEAVLEQFPGFDPTEQDMDFEELPNFGLSGKIRSFERRLGYNSEESELGKLVTVPTAKALEVNFNQLVPEYPELHLRPCKILATKGIVTNEEYIEAFTAGYFLLLSEDNGEDEEDESMHDHGAHADPLIKKALIHGDEFYAAFDRARGLIEKYYRQIQKAAEAAKQGKADFSEDEIEKLKFMIGIYVDGIWGNGELLKIDEAKFNQAPYEITGLWEMEAYQQVWTKQFKEEFDMGKLTQLWEKLLKFSEPA